MVPREHAHFSLFLLIMQSKYGFQPRLGSNRVLLFSQPIATPSPQGYSTEEVWLAYRTEIWEIPGLAPQNSSDGLLDSSFDILLHIFFIL